MLILFIVFSSVFVGRVKNVELCFPSKYNFQSFIWSFQTGVWLFSGPGTWEGLEPSNWKIDIFQKVYYVEYRLFYVFGRLSIIEPITITNLQKTKHWIILQGWPLDVIILWIVMDVRMNQFQLETFFPYKYQKFQIYYVSYYTNNVYLAIRYGNLF